MKYIVKNQENIINLNLNKINDTTYSGTYIFNLKSIQTDNVILLTETDISLYPNQYQKFIITSGDSNNMEVGQYLIKIFDIDDSETVIFQDIWNVNDVETDDNVYFFASGGSNTVFDVTGFTNAVPSTPVAFSASLLSTGVDIKLSWLQGSSNTTSFDLWRKLDSGSFLQIDGNVLSLIYNDQALDYDSTYTYKVRAKNSVGYSDFTNEISILTEASGATGITHTYIEWSGSTIVGSVGTYLDDRTILSNEGLNYLDGLLTIESGLTTSTIQTNDINIKNSNISWNSDDETIDVTLNDNVVGQMFQETFFNVKNGTDNTILNGTPVMFTEPVGVSGKVEIQPAISDGSLDSEYIMGLATQDILKGEFGKITNFGNVRGINTTGVPEGEIWVDGTLLYVSPFSGGTLTNIEPQAPNRRILVGLVVVSHTNGTILVRPTWTPKLIHLDDVNGTTVDTNGQILVWDNDNSVFDFNYNINDYLLTANESITGATNGLTKIGNNVVLGGTLTGDTTIDLDNNNISFTDGNVGIGTTTPLAKLHINGGTGSLSTGIAFGDGDTGFYEGSNNNLYVSAGGTLSFILSYTSNQSRNIIPFSSNNYDLGSTTRFWKNIYGVNIESDTISVNSGATINGNLNVFGDIIQNGSGYTTHAEHIYTTSDFITMRDGAIAELPAGDISGIAITKADGTNTVVLGADSDAVMRVGWSGETLQAIATREDNPLDGGITFWNETGTTLSTNSNLHWDDVNERLGIGTTAPLAKLHINGGTGSLSTGLAFGDGDTGFYEGSNDNLYVSAGGALSFILSYTSNQSRNIIPFSSNKYDLGSTTRFWKNIYGVNIESDTISVNSGATINGNLNVIGETILSGTTTGDLTVTGNFEMTDTQWTDLTFPATQTKTGSNLKPDFDETELALLFPENDESEKIYMVAQFGHERKNGSDIHPHIHYVQETADIPIFMMKYRWQDNGEIIPAWTTIESNGEVFPYTGGTSMLQIIGFNHIDGSAATGVSSMMDIIIYRKTGDGVSGDIKFKVYDIHYQMDSIGSDNEYTK